LAQLDGPATDDVLSALLNIPEVLRARSVQL
jgi:hypothetical protein